MTVKKKLIHKFGNLSIEKIEEKLLTHTDLNSFDHYALIKPGTKLHTETAIKELLPKHEVNLLDQNVLKTPESLFRTGDILLFLDEFASINMSEIYNFEFLKDSEIEYFNTENINQNSKFRIRRPAWSPLRFAQQNYFWDFYAIKLKKAEDLEIICTSLTSYILNEKFYSNNKHLVKHHEKILTLLNMTYEDYQDNFKRTIHDIQIKNFLGNESVSNQVGGNRSKKTTGVTVVIPTAFKLNYDLKPHLYNLLDSLCSDLYHENDEIIIVSDNKDFPLDFESFIKKFEVDFKLIQDKSEFNFSKRVNLAAGHAKNEIIVFINDDVEIVSDNAIEKVFEFLESDEVGVVGALLFYPSGFVQHGGHIYDQGKAFHAYCDEILNPLNGDLEVDREVSGVTGAFLGTKKSTWELVGGFSNYLPNSFNDVDFCIKVRLTGKSVIQLNSIRCVHKESSTRNPAVSKGEEEFLRDRWWAFMRKEEYTRPPQLL